MLDYAVDGPSPYATLWSLDPSVAMLNHGSFGACPREILQCQREWQNRLEAEPVRFLIRELTPLLDASRAKLADAVGTVPENLAMVRNATFAVNSVVRSKRFEPGDELLTTRHDYNACRNVLHFVAQQWGAKVVVADVPFPIRSPDEVIDAVMKCVTPKTRLAMLDHVTSPTAVILPVERLATMLEEQGVEVLVDGSHAVLSLPLELDTLGASYYTSNCHKWLCTPKGSAFLYVRPDRQESSYGTDRIHPAVISHGYNMACDKRSRFFDEFDWTGTDDPSPWLAVGKTIEFFQRRFGGLREVADHNHRLVVAARRMLCNRLGVEPPCPESMLSSMATVALPDAACHKKLEQVSAAVSIHPLQNELLHRYGIEVPILYWPDRSRCWIRISAHLYNDFTQYERLADALEELLGG